MKDVIQKVSKREKSPLITTHFAKIPQHFVYFVLYPTENIFMGDLQLQTEIS
ncbi:MAG: hypothetical protein GY695_25305 [Aestuariibacter sp.]|nr:hypothetical protein [Aestuariibacter sp.]